MRARIATSLGLALVAWVLVPASASALEEPNCPAREAKAREDMERTHWSEAEEAEYIQGTIDTCRIEHERWVREEASIAQSAEEQRAREVEEQRQLEAEERKERAEERRADHQYAAEERRRNRELAKQHREWAHKPTVTKGIAIKLAKKLMRESPFSIWEVECGGGRIDRTHWSCRVKIFAHCLRGRIRVWGEGYRNQVPWYGAHGGRLRQCTIHLPPGADY